MPTATPKPPRLAGRPTLDAAAAVRLVRERFGVAATAAHPLPSDRDQNFRIEADAGTAFVLKIANADTVPATLDAQHTALRRAHAEGLPVPQAMTAADGEPLIDVEGAAGERHLVRLLTYLPGVPMAKVSPRTPALRRRLGHLLGRLDRTLEDFDHPGLDRHFAWDVQHAAETIHARLRYVADAGLRARIEALARHAEAALAPRRPHLRRSAIHCDANDYNVLVSAAPTPEREITGLIDFGDLLRSYTVAEAAVAAAYAMLDVADPVGAAGELAAGYHAAYPLNEAEIEALVPLAVLRLGISACMAAYQQTIEPDVAYHAISQRPVRALLGRLDERTMRLAPYRLRHACGLSPCPTAEALAAWLADHAGEAAPVVQPDPRTAAAKVFDFSVGGAEADLTSADVLPQIEAAGADLGVGRYDEARLVYAAPQFATETGERRTIHLGLDLFQAAGAPVFAPFDGIIHSLADNARPLDYGPTILLEHRPEGGPTFYTLYGHLSRDSLEGISEGQPIRKGERLGRLGTPAENGGWAPHLHLQLIADLLGARGNFPGVAPPSQRAVWTSLCPDPTPVTGLPRAAFPEKGMSGEAIRAAREERIGPSLSLSYRRPLHIVRGIGAYLYDAEGRAFLDGVNNVAHVGHSHPRVVAALARQAALLNTNTRYLHEHLVRYAERLTATLPAPLRVCFFVNSGSEANDLALRLAYAHTGRRDVIVLDGAYHGHTAQLIGVSPYKFDGAGGAGRPATTHVVPMPDPYRGPYRAGDPEAGIRYAAHVRAAAEAAGRPAAFLAEPILSCGGQIEPPPGFLQAAYAHVRTAGGVCIADEVQIGFGRLGSHFWGFETQAAVPDIVTMGKPIGNGHPLGAVVTTPEIAASFANGMEYFNTFGGNPVSCAVGLAVLDVIAEEQLQAHALAVGNRLKKGLQDVQEEFPLVGDVRGRGLFLGLELVADRTTREPAPAQAAYIVNRLRERGILLSTDGPQHNVLKIKPPLVFSEADADRLVATLAEILKEDPAGLRGGEGERG